MDTETLVRLPFTLIGVKYARGYAYHARFAGTSVGLLLPSRPLAVSPFLSASARQTRNRIAIGRGGLLGHGPRRYEINTSASAVIVDGAGKHVEFPRVVPTTALQSSPYTRTRAPAIGLQSISGLCRAVGAIVLFLFHLLKISVCKLRWL